MTRTFVSSVWKREMIVDDNGISERREGCLVVFVPWHQLERLDRWGVRSESGDKIPIHLSPDRRREFVHCASAVWKQRYPERWQRNRERIRRASDWAAYFWLPLLTLGPCVAFYILDWLLGWPDALSPQLQKMNRLSIFGVLFIGAFICWYWFRSRKFAEPDGPANGSQPIRSETNRTSPAAGSRR